MLLRLILLFTLVPFLELNLLLAVAGTVGVPETLLLCLVTGVAGGALARREGLAVWQELNRQLAAGQMPGGPLLEGVLVFAGGLLLLTPGIATDLCGFLLVLPPTRRLAAGLLARRLAQDVSAGSVQMRVMGSAPGAAGPGASGFAPRTPALDPYADDPRIRRL